MRCYWELNGSNDNKSTTSHSPQKQKIWALWVHASSPHWLPRIFMPTFVYFHILPSVMTWAWTMRHSGFVMVIEPSQYHKLTIHWNLHKRNPTGYFTIQCISLVPTIVTFYVFMAGFQPLLCGSLNLWRIINSSSLNVLESVNHWLWFFEKKFRTKNPSVLVISNLNLIDNKLIPISGFGDTRWMSNTLY